ncbi:UDP-glucose 4-epimerase GalE [Idiomarina sp.]|uniref:UDP-glucose 4-epimerase GalE n=1 Tax=Idiomarina sp. TaxID=1874361 RepID=UPI001DACDFC2|nr:UDP-glucose 4-epimerase GalE [Idiomarina sp.]MCJ8316209.1 UDP-glucose 4-epimerase GalE [Idiomarina sp.]NQZ16122.1 UDP-glucose 4-epimerase GalE [Idiomarina sp.]
MILVTGGAGYIGSHTVLHLLKKGFDVVVVDNLINSSIESLVRVEKLANRPVSFEQVNLKDEIALNRVFEKYQVKSVIHFAGLKAVGESVMQPLSYYENNVSGSIRLLSCMSRHNVGELIFSSSATVYGDKVSPPYLESNQTSNPSSPYGRSKLFVEQILSDWHKSLNKRTVTILRYFNPVGADKSGLIGEDPTGTPNNLMPFISQVAVGKLDKLDVFGGDYNTSDGTCERDYIHVSDLAHGHVAALTKAPRSSLNIYNLGSGQPVSVLAMIEAFSRVNKVSVPYEIVGRRPGDLPAFWAVPDKARRELGWSVRKSIDDMVRDAWLWQSKNPNGYKND